MAAARGIAGSEGPEQQGCFVCLRNDDVEWFFGRNNMDGPVNVWVVGVDPSELRESSEGYFYVPRRIAPAALAGTHPALIAPSPGRRSTDDGRPRWVHSVVLRTRAGGMQ